MITGPNQKAAGRIDPIPLDLPYPVTLDYVTFGDDDGHQGPDVGFTKSDEALRNWASGAHKKTRDVALAIITTAYGKEPDRLYITGESAGGREAVIMAQRFPRDYDGIIATSPVLSWYAIHQGSKLACRTTFRSSGRAASMKASFINSASRLTASSSGRERVP